MSTPSLQLPPVENSGLDIHALRAILIDLAQILSSTAAQKSSIVAQYSSYTEYFIHNIHEIEFLARDMLSKLNEKYITLSQDHDYFTQLLQFQSDNANNKDVLDAFRALVDKQGEAFEQEEEIALQLHRLQVCGTLLTALLTYVKQLEQPILLLTRILYTNIAFTSCARNIQEYLEQSSLLTLSTTSLNDQSTQLTSLLPSDINVTPETQQGVDSNTENVTQPQQQSALIEQCVELISFIGFMLGRAYENKNILFEKLTDDDSETAATNQSSSSSSQPNDEPVYALLPPEVVFDPELVFHQNRDEQLADMETTTTTTRAQASIPTTILPSGLQQAVNSHLQSIVRNEISAQNASLANPADMQEVTPQFLGQLHTSSTTSAISPPTDGEENNETTAVVNSIDFSFEELVTVHFQGLDSLLEAIDSLCTRSYQHDPVLRVYRRQNRLAAHRRQHHHENDIDVQHDGITATDAAQQKQQQQYVPGDDGYDTIISPEDHIASQQNHEWEAAAENQRQIRETITDPTILASQKRLSSLFAKQTRFEQQKERFFAQKRRQERKQGIYRDPDGNIIPKDKLEEFGIRPENGNEHDNDDNDDEEDIDIDELNDVIDEDALNQDEFETLYKQDFAIHNDYDERCSLIGTEDDEKEAIQFQRMQNHFDKVIGNENDDNNNDDESKSQYTWTYTYTYTAATTIQMSQYGAAAAEAMHGENDHNDDVNSVFTNYSDDDPHVQKHSEDTLRLIASKLDSYPVQLTMSHQRFQNKAQQQQQQQQQQQDEELPVDNEKEEEEPQQKQQQPQQPLSLKLNNDDDDDDDPDTTNTTHTTNNNNNNIQGAVPNRHLFEIAQDELFPLDHPHHSTTALPSQLPNSSNVSTNISTMTAIGTTSLSPRLQEDHNHSVITSTRRSDDDDDDDHHNTDPTSQSPDEYQERRENSSYTSFLPSSYDNLEPEHVLMLCDVVRNVLMHCYQSTRTFSLEEENQDLGNSDSEDDSDGDDDDDDGDDEQSSSDNDPSAKAAGAFRDMLLLDIVELFESDAVVLRHVTQSLNQLLSLIKPNAANNTVPSTQQDHVDIQTNDNTNTTDTTTNTNDNNADGHDFMQFAMLLDANPELVFSGMEISNQDDTTAPSGTDQTDHAVSSNTIETTSENTTKPLTQRELLFQQAETQVHNSCIALQTVENINDMLKTIADHVQDQLDEQEKRQRIATLRELDDIDRQHDEERAEKERKMHKGLTGQKQKRFKLKKRLRRRLPQERTKQTK